MPLARPADPSSPAAEHPAHVLISGGGIAGPALALVLARAGHRVTVLERTDGGSTAGQNIDVRGPAREVLARFGLEDAVRAAGTGEEGTRFLGEDGRVLAEFPADEADGRGPTAELEILRSDLARILADACPDSVRWRFGTRIEEIREKPNGVHVRDTSGEEHTADALVVAEGVGSPTRSRLFPDGIQIRRLGLGMAFATLDRAEHDDAWWRWCIAAGGRSASLRPDPHGRQRALLSWNTESLESLDRTQVLDRIRRTYEGMGWEAPRILAGLVEAEDFYSDDLRQIRCSRWSTGRSVLLGDAAWCATPISGQGTSLALTGAWVLGAELLRALGSGRPVDEAFAAYEDWMRPVVEQAQRLPPGTPRTMHPESRAGLVALRGLLRAAASSPAQRLGKLFAARAPKGGAALPELP